MHFKTQMTKTKFRISYQKREMNKNELDGKKMKSKNEKQNKKEKNHCLHVVRERNKK
jgi:hypothetical protein